MDKDTRPVTGGTPYKVHMAHRARLGDLCFCRDSGRWWAVYGTVRGVNYRFKKAIKAIKAIKPIKAIRG